MKVDSTVFDILTSGKLGNVVGGSARGGIKWLRSRVTPTNPNSTFQSAIRNAMSASASAWKTTLTQGQRDAWDAYAAVVLKSGLSLTGENWFCAQDSLRRMANTLYLSATPMALVEDGPTTFSQASLTAPVPTVDASDDSLSFTFNTADDWAGTTSPGDSGLFIFMSPGISPSRQFNNQGYKLAGVVQNESPAITSPAVLGTLPFDYAAGDRVFLRFRAMLADGRFSPIYETSVIAQA